MTVTITNKTRRMKVFDLPHETYCAALGECACQKIDKPEQRIASSLTIPAGQQKEHLPDAVLAVAKVERAVRTGELKVRRERKREEPKKAKRKRGRKPRKQTSPDAGGKEN